MVVNKIKLGMMKTSKAKVGSVQKKTYETGKVEESKKVGTSKSGPSEEEIRAKAKEIYHDRIAHGKHGTAAEDWIKAEEILRGSKK